MIIRSFSNSKSVAPMEPHSDRVSVTVPRQAMSVREILNRFVATGQVPPGASDEQYGEDPTARPDYDLVDAFADYAAAQQRITDRLDEAKRDLTKEQRVKLKKQLQEERANLKLREELIAELDAEDVKP